MQTEDVITGTWELTDEDLARMIDRKKAELESIKRLQERLERQLKHLKEIEERQMEE